MAARPKRAKAPDVEVASKSELRERYQKANRVAFALFDTDKTEAWRDACRSATVAWEEMQKAAK